MVEARIYVVFLTYPSDHTSEHSPPHSGGLHHDSTVSLCILGRQQHSAHKRQADAAEQRLRVCAAVLRNGEVLFASFPLKHTEPKGGGPSSSGDPVYRLLGPRVQGCVRTVTPE